MESATLGRVSDARLRILYVNGAAEGGSLISTQRLCGRLSARGHAVTLLHGRRGGERTERVYKRATNLEVKLGGRVGAHPLRRVNERIGARRRTDESAVVRTWTAYVVENSARRALGEPYDVLVVSSVLRVAWLRLHRLARARGVPIVLYLREEALLAHLDLGAPPDLVLANSEALAEAVRARGEDCSVVPSVVDLAESRVDSTRRIALVVNPGTDYGMERVLELAAANPDIPFALQLSFQLTGGEHRRLSEAAAELPNVEIRPFTSDLTRVYGDARVMVAPYTETLESNRPRSVLEAQANGIPVLGSATAGLVETIGPGGITVAREADLDEWSAALRRLWSDDGELAEASRRHASRPEVDPDRIVDRFEAALASLAE